MESNKMSTGVGLQYPQNDIDTNIVPHLGSIM